MLLLTAVTFGGTDGAEAFDHLPDEESELLKHRANELMQIPRDKRIPLLVQEIKRLVTQRRRQLGSADPKRLAEVLGKERGAVVEVVLRALPAQLADQVRDGLPDHAKVKLQREVRPEVLSIVRWKLEEALKRASPPGGIVFRFSDLLTLQQRELLTICDRMGARALATAIAGLPEAAREQVLQSLPPDQRSLAQRAADAGKERRLTEGDSITVMKMYGALEQPSVGLRSAGAQRLARACVAQSPEFAARLIERHKGELGKLLQRWVREERNRPMRGDGGRADIVEQMERLALRGVIDRPMRLPPPPKAAPQPLGGPGLVPLSAVAPLPGGKLLPPPPKHMRDAVAEREARKAGAVPRPSTQSGPHRRSENSSSTAVDDPRPSFSRGGPSPRAPNAPRPDPTLPPPPPPPSVSSGGRRSAPRPLKPSPTLQEIPKRRPKPPAPETKSEQRAPEAKRSQGKGGGRLPGKGSS